MAKKGRGPLQALFKRLPNGRLKNIAAGYWEHDSDGNPLIFHPIRASYDYSGSRVGESKKKSKRKPKSRKRKSRR